MASRIKNANELLAQSWAIVSADKSILILPFLGLLATLAVWGVAFLIVHLLGQSLLVPLTTALVQRNPVPFIAYFLSYFASAFSVTFFNTALISILLRRLRGQPATIRYGLAEARRRIVLIAQWSLFISTIGMILKLLEERTFNMGGFLVTRIFDIAFSVASFLALPVLVAENKTPLAAMKGSVKLLRKSWGEQLVGSIQLGLVFGVLFGAGMVIMVPGIMMLSMANGDPIGVSIGAAATAIGGGMVIVVFALSGAINCVFRSALYLFASDGFIAQGFNGEMLESSLRKSAAS